MHGFSRARWAAIGAAVAVSLGAGGLGIAQAAIGSGPKPVTVTVAPERVLDTRTNLGLTGAMQNDTPRELVVVGNVAVAPSGTKTVVPADATGVIVNVTVVGPTSAGYLSLRPGGTTGEPTSSTVNFSSAGGVFPNAATVALGAGGTVQIWLHTAANGGNADVLLDIVGYTVDHNHDDRYYTKDQIDSASITEVISGPAFAATAGGVTVHAAGGCAYNNTTIDPLVASFQVPVGYEIVDARAAIVDNNVASEGIVSVNVAGSTIVTAAIIGTTGAPGFQRGIEGDVTPGVVVDPGEFVYLSFDSIAPGATVQICAVEITMQKA